MPRFANLQKAVLLLIIVSLTLFAFMSLLTRNTTTNVSAVESAQGVGVYWDSNCTQRVFSINWGNLTPGSVKNISVFIQNEMDQNQFLRMKTVNWTLNGKQSTATPYLTLNWTYNWWQSIGPREVVHVQIILSVSSNIEGISNFTFDILINGTENLPGDINGNGRIDLEDVGKLDLIFGGYITDPELVARGDINGNGVVDLGDIGKLDLFFSSSK